MGNSEMINDNEEIIQLLIKQVAHLDQQVDKYSNLVDRLITICEKQAQRISIIEQYLKEKEDWREKLR